MEPLSQSQKQFQNRNHEAWLQLPATQEFLSRLQVAAQSPAPIFIHPGDVECFQAYALVRAGIQQVHTLAQLPPYPEADQPEHAQQVFDFSTPDAAFADYDYEKEN